MNSISFRGLLFFIKLSILVFIALVLKHYPGEIQISWLGYRLQTSPAIFLIGLLLVTSLLVFLISIWRYIWGLPVFWTSWCQKKRLKKSETAFMDGLTALLSGELDQAEKLVGRANSLYPKNPLNQLLLAQVAFDSKKYENAELVFLELSQNQETAFIGLKGLYKIAAVRKDYNQMRLLLRQAIFIQPNSPWALKNLFEMDLKAGSFDKAELIMEQLALSQEIPPEQSAHHLGIVYWLRAKQLKESGDQDGFLKQAHKAFKSAPELTEVAVSLVGHYHKSGQDSKSKKIVKEAFTANPHRELAILWEKLHSEKTSLELYKELEMLTSSHPNDPVSLAVLARGAIKAKLWGQARHHLNDLLKTGQKAQTYALLAELEEAENPGNHRLIQDWLRKATSASTDQPWKCSSCNRLLA